MLQDRERIADPRRFLLQKRFPRREAWAAACALLLVLIVVRFTAFCYLNSRWLGGIERDAGLYVWLVKSNLRDLFTAPWFDTSAFYPYTRTLAWSDNFILPSLAVWLLTRLGLSLVAAYNVVLLTANFLNGFVTYLLCRRLCGRTLPSVAAGAAFMSFSFLTGHLGHPQLQFAFWLPLAVHHLMSFFAAPRLPAALWIGFSVFGCFLCSVYYAVLIPPLLAALTAAFFLLRPKHLSLRQYLLLIVGALPWLLLLLPFVLPYLEVQRTFGPRRLYEAFAFSASALSYLSAPALNMIYGASARLSHPEAQLFPGMLVLIAAGAAFLRLLGSRRLRALAMFLVSAFAVTVLASALAAKGPSSLQHLRFAAAAGSWVTLIAFMALLYRLGRMERAMGYTIMTNRGLIAAFLFCALLFFTLSLGPLGNPAAKQIAPGVFAAFYALVPGAEGLRAVSRIGVVVILCLIVTAPFILALISRARGWGLGFYAVLTTLIVAENVHKAIPVEGESAPPPVFFRAAAMAEPGDALIVLPMAAQLLPDGRVQSWSQYALLNISYMQWALPSGLRVVNGYSGLRSKMMLEYPRKMSRFPDERSLNALRAVAGLRFVIFIPSLLPAFDRDSFQENLRRFPVELRHIETDANGNYLFEHSPETRLDEQFSLRVPSHPQGSLEISLRALYEEGEPQFVVYCFLKEHSEHEPIHALRLAADGRTHSFAVPLPKTSDSVRPLTLFFRADSGAKIVVGRSRFVAGR